MRERKEAQKILGVESDVGSRELRRAYLKAVKRHPPESDPEGFTRVRAAFDLLADDCGEATYSTVMRHPPERDPVGPVRVHSAFNLSAGEGGSSGSASQTPSESHEPGDGIDAADREQSAPPVVDPEAWIPLTTERSTLGRLRQALSNHDATELVPLLEELLNTTGDSPAPVPMDEVSRLVLIALRSGEVWQARRAIELARQLLTESSSELESFTHASLTRWMFAQELARIPERANQRYRAAIADALLDGEEERTARTIARVYGAGFWDGLLTPYLTPRMYRFVMTRCRTVEVTRRFRLLVLFVAVVLIGGRFLIGG